MRYAFIFGCDRSGTTYLSATLARKSDDILLFPEAQWLGDYLVFRKLGYSASRFIQHCKIFSRLKPWQEIDIPIEDFLTRAWSIQDIKESVDYIFREAAGLKGMVIKEDSVVLEHTPWSWTYYDVYKEFLRGCQWAHVVRDGRDVAISLTKRGWGPNTLYFGFRFWRDNLSNISHVISNNVNEIYEIKYESFLVENERLSTGLLQHFRIQHSPRQFEFELTSSYSNQHENINKLVDLSRIGVWEKLSEKEKKVFRSDLMGIKLLKDYGYEAPEYEVLGNRKRAYYWFLEILNKCKRLWA